jgi:nitroreductase
MEFDKVYLGRRSIRRYKNKNVPLNIIGDILDLAEFAPSSGNLQNWKFVVVTELEKRQAIADASLQQSWMVDAPVHIVICNDYNKVKEHYGKLGKMYSIQNCANVAFGIMLAAYDRGLGSCWVGAFDNEAVQRVLEIPEEFDPEIIITIGYADETKKPSQRGDLNEFVFINNWNIRFTDFPSHLNNLKEVLKKHIKKIK